MTQHGCDTHWLDPLAHLNCSVDGQRTAYRRLAELAGSCAGGKWVALGGGGYEVGQVVPRAWTHLLAEITGEPVNGSTPDDWQQEVIARVGGPAPANLTDRDATAWRRLLRPRPWEGSTGTALDESIDATRQAVFGFHGLQP